ncbi:MAG: hypothetical protein FD146_469 [Anaerolineaceae bacterium]|nr:MAG: hypothetical protein FD146_469 [Anaerolineaceae bacterium]
MREGGLSGLAFRIRQELSELERVQERISEGWQRARRSNDDYYLDSVALNLHGFYSGLERIFTLIASNIDGDLPQGENWHTLLLEQMTKEVPRVRPAVLSSKVARRLNEYRGFRHVVRNVYTYRFDPARVEKLAVSAPNLLAALKDELTAFAAFLDEGG